MLETVGLTGEMLDPLSARVLRRSTAASQHRAAAPWRSISKKLVIADEPVSALDVSVRSQVLNLMVRLQRERQLAYIFISHDLSVVEHISDSVAIMYLGRIVEKGPTDRIFAHPAHPSTRALMEAIPDRRSRKQRRTAEPMRGEAPSPVSPPPGLPVPPALLA